MVLIILISVMVISFFGVIVFAKFRARNPKNPMFLWICVLILLPSLLFFLYYTGIFGSRKTSILRKREYSYSTSRAYVIAEYLKEKSDGKKALIITLAGYENDNRSRYLINTIIKSLEPEIETLTVPLLLDDENLHHYDQMNAADFNRMINPRKDCDIIISTISLPGDFFAIEVFEKDPQNIPFIVVVDGDLEEIHEFIADGKIKMVIVNRPDSDISSKKVPDDPKNAFDKRYLMVTPENISEIKNSYKKLF